MDTPAPSHADVERVLAFRDPAPVDPEGARLKAEIVRVLVNAPSLPVRLPAVGMRMVDVDVDGKGFELLLEESGPAGRLRIERPSTEGAASVTALAVKTRVPMFEVLAQRLRLAITPERWEQARALAKQYRALPVGVPLDAFRQLVPGMNPAVGLVRIGFRCNQDCGICWQGRDWGRFDGAQVRTWIEDFARAGARSLIISGGEPTLDPDLEGHLRYAASLGFSKIQLETNAIQLGKADHAKRLRAAGLTDALVSLHSGDPATSDAITRAPGTHAGTVRGAKALLDAGVTVYLNAVLTAEGLDHVPALPDFVHASFAAYPSFAGLVLSSPCDPFDKSRIPSIAADPARVRRALRPAVRRALDLGLQLRNVDGPCGFPLCAIGTDERLIERGRVAAEVPFRTFLPPCDGCSVKRSCFGVRRNEAEMWGERCVEAYRAGEPESEDPTAKRVRLPLAV